jgi:hypothetical protein
LGKIFCFVLDADPVESFFFFAGKIKQTNKQAACPQVHLKLGQPATSSTIRLWYLEANPTSNHGFQTFCESSKMDHGLRFQAEVNTVAVTIPRDRDCWMVLAMAFSGAVEYQGKLFIFGGRTGLFTVSSNQGCAIILFCIVNHLRQFQLRKHRANAWISTNRAYVAENVSLKNFPYLFSEILKVIPQIPPDSPLRF